METPKTEISKTLDLSLIFFIAVALAICKESYSMGIGTLNYPEAGFLPFMLGLLLGILSTARLVIDLGAKGSLGLLKVSISTKRVVPVLAVLFAYAFLLDILGFLVNTFLLVFILIKIIESKPWWLAGMVSLGATLLCYLIFRVWLQVQLPKGLLAF